MEEVEIKESILFKNIKPVLINGLPEIGLVGSTASMHLVDSLKLSDIGFPKGQVVLFASKRL